MIELEQLKQLVFDGGFDGESRNEVLRIESELQEVAAAEKIAELPTIKKFVDYLNSREIQAKALLLNDRTLTDRDRDKLFERIDLCEHFTSLFTGSKREQIEESIKQLLNVAKG